MSNIIKEFIKEYDHTDNSQLQLNKNKEYTIDILNYSDEDSDTEGNTSNTSNTSNNIKSFIVSKTKKKNESRKR